MTTPHTSASQRGPGNYDRNRDSAADEARGQDREERLATATATAGFFGRTWALVKTAATEWWNDDAFSLGAALSFYTVFSLAPLILITIALAGLLWDRQEVSSAVTGELGGLMGKEGGELVGAVVENAGDPRAGRLATVLGILAAVVGATGVLAQLKATLNTVWEVEPKPGRGLWNFVRTRLLSFAMILCIAFLLIVSLIASAALAAMGEWAGHLLPVPEAVMHAANSGLSFVIITVLFALIYRYLPDANVGWREVWFGALVTSLLFVVGKFFIGLYIGKSGLASPYGAAGSAIVVMVWVYYSSLIFLMGAELTQVRAHQLGKEIQPADYAVHTREKAFREAAREEADREDARTRPAAT